MVSSFLDIHLTCSCHGVFCVTQECIRLESGHSGSLLGTNQLDLYIMCVRVCEVMCVSVCVCVCEVMCFVFGCGEGGGGGGRVLVHSVNEPD